jgi:hypothetical protein
LEKCRYAGLEVLGAMWQLRGSRAYLSFQSADEKTFEDFSCFVAVADIFESLGCVLAANIDEDFFTTSVMQPLIPDQD